MLNKLLNADYLKVFKGAVIAALGAGVAYLTQYLSGQDFGVYTPLVVALSSVLVNWVRQIANADGQGG